MYIEKGGDKMLGYQNNDTLRELLNYNNLNLRDSIAISKKYIAYSYPANIEEEKMFKDILDQGYDVCFPVIANTTALSELALYPIKIDFYGDDDLLYSIGIGPYDGFRDLVKNKHMYCNTISQDISSTDTLKIFKRHSEIKNRTIKNCVY